MPPKKRARLSPLSASTPQQETPNIDTATPTAPDTPSKRGAVDLDDPWTDDQEIALFKGMIKWKPAGMHKHFRMIALSEYIRDHAHTSVRDVHTRIPGIWKKLESLYDLAAIDERENSFLEAEEGSKDSAEEEFYPFVLPKDEYLDLMLERAPKTDGSATPSMLEKPKPAKRGAKASRQSGRARRASTIEDTEDEPRSSPMAGRGNRGGRRTRNAKQTPTGRLQAETRASSGRRGSKVPSPADEEDPATGEDANEEANEDDEEEKGEEEEENEDEDVHDDSTTGGSPLVRSTRNIAKPTRGGGVKKSGRGGLDRRRSTRKK